MKISFEGSQEQIDNLKKLYESTKEYGVVDLPNLIEDATEDSNEMYCRKCDGEMSEDDLGTCPRCLTEQSIPPTQDSDLNDMELWKTDGVEYEIWEDKTGKKYRICIEREENDESGHPNIERDWDSVETSWE